jgi:hypothetical protein
MHRMLQACMLAASTNVGERALTGKTVGRRARLEERMRRCIFQVQ